MGKETHLPNCQTGWDMIVPRRVYDIDWYNNWRCQEWGMIYYLPNIQRGAKSFLKRRSIMGERVSSRLVSFLLRASSNHFVFQPWFFWKVKHWKFPEESDRVWSPTISGFCWPWLARCSTVSMDFFRETYMDYGAAILTEYYYSMEYLFDDSFFKGWLDTYSTHVDVIKYMYIYIGTYQHTYNCTVYISITFVIIVRFKLHK